MYREASVRFIGRYDFSYLHLLTYAAGGEHSYGIIWRCAVREERFKDVDAESQGHDGLAARTHYHTLDPQSDERQERPEGLHDVCIIRARLPDHAAELGVAVSSYLSKGTREKDMELIFNIQIFVILKYVY